MQDIADIVHAFKSGTSKHILAKRYGINERSLSDCCGKRETEFVEGYAELSREPSITAPIR